MGAADATGCVRNVWLPGAAEGRCTAHFIERIHPDNMTALRLA